VTQRVDQSSSANLLDLTIKKMIKAMNRGYQEIWIRQRIDSTDILEEILDLLVNLFRFRRIFPKKCV
jgi:hypothetical protein